MAKKQNSLEDSIIQDKNDNVIDQTIEPEQSKINQLVDEIRHHRYLYYNKTPKITPHIGFKSYFSFIASGEQ